MKLFQLHPEVAGNIASSDFIDRTARPPKIKRLRYEFDGWSGDDLITSIATFIVTDRLRERIERENLSGIIFADAEIFISEQFKELFGQKLLPKFYWMQITGKLEKDDFSMSPTHRLVVSSKVISLLKEFQLSSAEILPYKKDL